MRIFIVILLTIKAISAQAQQLQPGAIDEFKDPNAVAGIDVPITETEPPIDVLDTPEYKELLERLDEALAALEQSQAQTERAREDAQRVNKNNRETIADLNTEIRRMNRQMERLQNSQATAVLPADNSDELRQQQLEAARLAAQEAEERSIRAPGVIFDGGSSQPSNLDQEGFNPSDSPEARVANANELWKRQNPGVILDMQSTERFADPTNTLVQGTVIQASMDTALNSDLPGEIRATVNGNVHSMNGARILIPKGSKLIGRYNSAIEHGQLRALIVWNRVVTTENLSIELDAYGADALGRSGASSVVDNHYGTRFGGAAMVSILSSLPAALARESDNNTTIEIGNNVTNTLSDSTSDIIAQQMARAPTVHVDQGALVSVFVDRDVYFGI